MNTVLEVTVAKTQTRTKQKQKQKLKKRKYMTFTTIQSFSLLPSSTFKTTATQKEVATLLQPKKRVSFLG